MKVTDSVVIPYRDLMQSAEVLGADRRKQQIVYLEQLLPRLEKNDKTLRDDEYRYVPYVQFVAYYLNLLRMKSGKFDTLPDVLKHTPFIGMLIPQWLGHGVFHAECRKALNN